MSHFPYNFWGGVVVAFLVPSSPRGSITMAPAYYLL